MSLSFGNTFLSRDDLASFREKKNHLEPEYADAYNAWKAKDTEESRDKLLGSISPFLAEHIGTISGADPNYLRIQSKVLAMKAMSKYDPQKSSLKTFLNYQMMPLRRNVRQQMNVLGVPDRLLVANHQMDNTETELQEELGRMPTTLELADCMAISPKQIERLRRLSHATNTGGETSLDDENVMGDRKAIRRNLSPEYRHIFVQSALKNDPKSALIYEFDNRLNGRRNLSTADLAKKLGLSPNAVSQRRARIAEIVNRAEKDIYG